MSNNTSLHEHIHTHKIQVEPQPFSSKLQSTKLHIALAMSATSSLFLWTKRMNASEWINFSKWIFGIYATGNVGQKAAEHLRSNGIVVSQLPRVEKIVEK